MGIKVLITLLIGYALFWYRCIVNAKEVDSSVDI